MAHPCQLGHLHSALYNSNELDQYRIIDSIQRHALVELYSTYGNIHHLHRLRCPFPYAKRTSSCLKMESWATWDARQYRGSCLQLLGMLLVILAKLLSRHSDKYELGGSPIRRSAWSQCHSVCHTCEKGIRRSGGEGEEGLLICAEDRLCSLH